MNFCCCTFFSYFCSLWYNTFTNCWVSNNLELEKNYTHFIEKFNKRLILFSEKVVSWCCVYLWNKIYTPLDMWKSIIPLFVSILFQIWDELWLHFSSQPFSSCLFHLLPELLDAGEHHPLILMDPPFWC